MVKVHFKVSEMGICQGYLLLVLLVQTCEEQQVVQNRWVGTRVQVLSPCHVGLPTKVSGVTD